MNLFPAILRRDAGPRLLMRADGRIREINAETRTIIFDLSSETPVDRWGDSEILRHDAASVRLERLRTVGSLHLFHDTRQPVAAIRDAQIVDRKLRITAQFGQTQAAKDALQNVVDGVIRGFSVGYAVHAWEVNQDTRTYTATDWEPFEATLTTIPADPTVGIGRSSDDQALWSRSISDATSDANKARNLTMKISLRALLALMSTFPYLTDELAARAESGTDEEGLRTWAKAQPKPGTPAPAAAPGDERARANELAQTRTELQSAERALKLSELARSHGIDTTGLDLRSYTDETAGVTALLARKAGAEERRPAQPVGAVTVTADGQQKRMDAAMDALVHMYIPANKLAFARGKNPDAFQDLSAKDLGMRRCSPREIVRRMVPDLAQADEHQVALFATRQFGELSRSGLQLRDANQSAANFAVTLGNFMDKAVLIGYLQNTITHTAWTSQRLVRDFKPVGGAALQAGLLKEQAVKGAPGEEINLLEKSYQASLGLFLRTVSFTYQDWRNDDLGLFTDEITNLGGLAAQTEEWQVYRLLLGLTWTGFVTTGAAFWDDTNDRLKYTGYGLAEAALVNRSVAVGDETIPIQPVPGFMLVPAKRRAAAKALIGQGPSNNLPQAAPDYPLQVISTPWLSNASLTGFSADDYYIGAANMDTVKVLRDQLNPNPSIRQIDAGATPDMKFLVMHAFRAALASQDGLQKGQWT